MLTLSPRQRHLLSWFVLPDEHYHCSVKTKQMQPYIYTRALSPFKAALLDLLLACLLHSCATNRPAREYNPFPAHVHLLKKLPHQDNGGMSDQPLQTKRQRLPAMAPEERFTSDQATGEFNIQFRSKIFHDLQQFKNRFWLYYAQLPAHPPLELLPLCWRLQRAQGDLTLTLANKLCQIS